MRKRTEGFSLIEAAVAIAIMAIMAGAALPLAMKAVTQQREQTTRDSLKLIYQNLFGLRDHRVANMVADFGYDPGGIPNPIDLRDMTTIPNPALKYPMPNVGFNCGWNGPYWLGSVAPAANTNGLPLDSWGNPFALRRPNPAVAEYQVVSGGPDGVIGAVVNGVPNQAALDDLVYPQTANGVPTVYPASIYVYFVNTRSATDPSNPLINTPDADVTVTITARGTPIAPITRKGLAAGLGKDSAPFPTVPPGLAEIRIQVPMTGYAKAVDSREIVDLLPGQAYTVHFNF